MHNNDNFSQSCNVKIRCVCVCIFRLCSPQVRVQSDSLPLSVSVNQASVDQVTHRKRALSHGNAAPKSPKVTQGRGEVTSDSCDHLGRYSDGSCLFCFVF